MNTFPVRISQRTVEAEDIVSIELRQLDDSELPRFEAGAHIDVVAGDGLVRQYSLCNPPHERHRYVIGVQRDRQSRGGSIAIHETFREDDVVQIGTPRNHFPLVPAQRYLLLAGGIGVTPLLSMSEQLWRSGAWFELHYCTRSDASTAFRARLEGSPFASWVRFHRDDGPQDQLLDFDALLAHPDDDTRIYLCGPEGFIAAATGAAARHGWHPGKLHVEHFTAPCQGHGDAGAFQVKIASSGKTYEVPRDRNIVAVLAEHGIAIPMSCEQGFCGTCITRVLDGVPDHRDEYFTEEERARNDQILPCCSRAKTRMLVLDL